jgi:MFS family permease
VTASSRLPPALNIIALATFAASLSARALDPVLPHVADEFGVSIATAASFAAVFAFTFAIIQPVLGAAADLFGKARLMIVCLVLLGVATSRRAVDLVLDAVCHARLHSFFFFMGQTLGPIAYGLGIQQAGKVPTLLAAAAVMIALGFACARLLRQSRPADVHPVLTPVGAPAGDPR